MVEAGGVPPPVAVPIRRTWVFGRVTQLEECLPDAQNVGGSSPSTPTRRTNEEPS